MENYNEAMDIAATSTASAGTAEEKYAAYTEGMEASVSGLTAAWEKLIAKLKASEGLKWLVDSAKKLLDLLAEFPPEEYFCVSTDNRFLKICRSKGYWLSYGNRTAFKREVFCYRRAKNGKSTRAFGG